MIVTNILLIMDNLNELKKATLDLFLREKNTLSFEHKLKSLFSFYRLLGFIVTTH